MSAAHYEYIVTKMTSLSRTENPVCLDFGCGGGNLIVHARQKGFDVVGVDVESITKDKNRPSVEKNNLVFGKDIYPYDGETLPFADKSFDIVVANMVFEHIAEPKKYFQEIHRVLKKNGCLLALFPTAETIWEGHLELYWVHKINKFEKLQYKYIVFMDKLGLGKNRGRNETDRVSLQRLHSFLREGCFYHSSKEIFKVWKDVFGMEPQTDEVGYLASRLNSHPRLGIFSGMVQWPVIRPFAKALTILRLTRVFIGTRQYSCL